MCKPAKYQQTFDWRSITDSCIEKSLKLCELNLNFDCLLLLKINIHENLTEGRLKTTLSTNVFKNV